MKLSQLSLADYNQLDSIPVINQDLSASGFTPVANTYYRHTGATTDTFTQGVIYLYDTAYHKLGESGGTAYRKLGESGGTTLNKYVYNVDLSSPTYAIRERILNIAKNAKKYSMYASCNIGTSDGKDGIAEGNLSFSEYAYEYSGILHMGTLTSITATLINYGDSISKVAYAVNNNSILSISNWHSIQLKIIYYNDTEITA